MENPTPEPSSSNPAPEPALPAPAETPEPAPAETPAEPGAEQTDPLLALARAAKAARLKPDEEERATALLKERLTGGKVGINTALPAMTEGLPWAVCVNALGAVWEGLTAPMRRHVLSSIAKAETEPARRLRLSLARGLFKVDPAAGLKLAAAAAAGLKDPETSALSNKHRQFFFNVFVGKGKPWLAQLPLGDLKPAEAEALIHAAIESFTFCPPFSQLAILRWIFDAGRFKKISPAGLAMVTKSLGRWNLKYQRQLRTEIAELPPELEAALKPEALQPAPEAAGKTKAAQKHAGAKPPMDEPASPESEAKTEPEAEGASEETAPLEPPEELVIPGRAERLAKEAQETQEPREPKESRHKANERRREKEQPERAETREPRELRRPEKGGRAFDVKEALRGVESYITGLRNELETTKKQLTRQETRRGRPERSEQRPEETLPPGEIEALKRHNARLEETVAALRSELEDLARSGEAVAESRQMYGDTPLADGGAEALKALLSIKLQEAFETYHAMRLEPLDKVFRLDYRDLLGSVFDILLEQGVDLKKITNR